jgi:hypothetical protein
MDDQVDNLKELVDCQSDGVVGPEVEQFGEMIDHGYLYLSATVKRSTFVRFGWLEIMQYGM